MKNEKSQNNAKQELQSTLDKLRRNVEGLGSLDIISKKYPGAYKKMMLQIKQGVSEVYMQYILTALNPMKEMTPEEHKNVHARLSEILHRNEMKQLASRILRSVIQTQDADQIYSLGLLAFLTVRKEIYIPYWLKHIEIKGGRYYSSLLDMWYDEHMNIWEGDGYYTIMYPPTEYTCNIQIDSELSMCRSLLYPQTKIA